MEGRHQSSVCQYDAGDYVPFELRCGTCDVPWVRHWQEAVVHGSSLVEVVGHMVDRHNQADTEARSEPAVASEDP